MQQSTLVLLYDYLITTRVGNVIVFFIGALIFYAIFRLVIKIIDYIVFKRLMNRVLQAIYEEEDDEYNDAVPASNHEDEQSQKKDKKREQIREAERMQNMENEFKTRGKPKQKIVGMAQPLGKWTARVMKQWIQKHQHIDMNMVNDLGYFQALVIAERKAQGIDIGGGKQNGGMSR